MHSKVFQSNDPLNRSQRLHVAWLKLLVDQLV